MFNLKHGFAVLARPLNLADNYEIVGGVPTFVWKPSAGRDANYRTYAVSSDGTRIAIQEGFHRIW